MITGNASELPEGDEGMNREESRKAAKIMLHYADGGEVEFSKRSIPSVGGPTDWESHERDVNFDWHHYTYRIKPREFIIEQLPAGKNWRALPIEDAPWFDPELHIKVIEVL